MFIREASPLLKQIWTVSSVLLFNVGFGMMNAQTTLDSFKQEDSSMRGVVTQSSWIGSTEPLIIIFGLLSTALLMRWFGRRIIFIMITVTFIISCCTIYFGTSTKIIAVGRTFGFFASPGVIFGAMAIGEYTSPSYRGIFLTLTSAALEIGRTTAYFIGDYKVIAVLALVLNILSFSVACTWDESPYFLVSRYKYDDCKKSFVLLRGTSFNESQELANLLRKGKEDESKIRKEMGILETLLDAVKQVATRKFLKPIIVLLLASILVEASGKTIFDNYGSQIICEIFGKHSTFYVSAINVIVPISIILSSISTTILKRKTLLLLTGSKSVLVLFIISFTLFLISNTVISISNLGPVALLLFVMLTNLSCTTIFLTWCGELFSFEHKSTGLVITGLLFNLNSYVCLKITPYLINGLKLYGLFGLLTVLLTLVLLTLYFIAPETHDKSLLQIECYFKNGCFESEGEEQTDNEDIFLRERRKVCL